MLVERGQEPVQVPRAGRDREERSRCSVAARGQGPVQLRHAREGRAGQPDRCGAPGSTGRRQRGMHADVEVALLVGGGLDPGVAAGDGEVDPGQFVGLEARRHAPHGRPGALALDRLGGLGVVHDAAADHHLGRRAVAEGGHDPEVGGWRAVVAPPAPSFQPAFSHQRDAMGEVAQSVAR